MENNTRKNIFLNTLSAALGLVLFGVGVYLTIQANLGVGPWDTFSIGLSKTLNIKYGTASIAISLAILGLDVLLREKIGIGMLLDAFIVGKTVDLLNYINLVPERQSVIFSYTILFAGMIVMGFSQYLYMKAGLGCGPRDSFLVGLKRKMPKIPIGIISIFMLATVTFFGWLLHGPIGIGTLLCAGFEGVIMQFEFKLMKFVPTSVNHQNIFDSLKIIFSKSGKKKENT